MSEDNHGSVGFAENALNDGRLCEQVAAGDADAGREFYNKYHRRAEHFGYIAARYCVAGTIDQDDLTQESLLHMLEQTRSYDPSKNVPFNAFIALNMKAVLNNELSTQYGIHVSRNALPLLNAITNEESRRQGIGLQSLTDEEIAELCDVPLDAKESNTITVKTLRQAVHLTRGVKSLDYEYSSRADRSSSGSTYSLDECGRLSSVHGEKPSTVEEKVERILQKEAIYIALESLAESERCIIRMKFGLDDDEPKSQKEIAAFYNKSREWVHQTEIKAMEKLRTIAPDFGLA